MLRDYTAPAPLPTPVTKKEGSVAGLHPKRKGSENDILVDGEGEDAEEGELRAKPAAAGGAGGPHPGEKRPRREHSWQKQKDGMEGVSVFPPLILIL